MRPSIPSLLVAVLLCAGLNMPAAADPPTPATHYRWKDVSGVLHYGDTIPSSALAGGYDIINDRGLVVRHIGRELTAAERRTAAAAAARTAAAKRAAQQQRLADTQLLSAYPTEHALQQLQQAQLRQIQTDIASLATNLHGQEDSLTEMLAHAADLEHSGSPVPPYINKNIADQRETVNDERSALAQRRTDLANTESRFAAQLDHYRSLRAKLGGDDDVQQP